MGASFSFPFFLKSYALGEEISGALGFLKDNKKKQCLIFWYGGTRYMHHGMVVFHDQFVDEDIERFESPF